MDRAPELRLLARSTAAQQPQCGEHNHHGADNGTRQEEKTGFHQPRVAAARSTAHSSTAGHAAQGVGGLTGCAGAST